MPCHRIYNACQHCSERLHSKDRVSTGRPDGHNVCSSLCSIVFGVVFESPISVAFPFGTRCGTHCGTDCEFRVCSRCLCRCVRELCSTEHVFEVCSCVRTCVRRVRVDSLVKGTCVRAFDGTRSRNTEILCSSVFRVREQLRYIYSYI